MITLNYSNVISSLAPAVTQSLLVKYFLLKKKSVRQHRLRASQRRDAKVECVVSDSSLKKSKSQTAVVYNIYGFFNLITTEPVTMRRVNISKFVQLAGQ